MELPSAQLRQNVASEPTVEDAGFFFCLLAKSFSKRNLLFQGHPSRTSGPKLLYMHSALLTGMRSKIAADVTIQKAPFWVWKFHPRPTHWTLPKVPSTLTSSGFQAHFVADPSRNSGIWPRRCHARQSFLVTAGPPRVQPLCPCSHLYTQHPSSSEARKKTEQIDTLLL